MYIYTKYTYCPAHCQKANTNNNVYQVRSIHRFTVYRYHIYIYIPGIYYARNVKIDWRTDLDAGWIPIPRFALCSLGMRFSLPPERCQLCRPANCQSTTTHN